MPKAPDDLGRGLELGVEDFVTDEITGINLYTYADRTKETLRKIGIGEQSKRPQLEEAHKGVFSDLKPGDYFNGRMPVVIRRLTLDQLSALYSLFTSWYGYLTFQTNLIAIERSEASKQKEFLWSHIRKLFKYNSDGTKNSDTVMSDMARGDYRFAKANARYEELNVLYNCMLATLEVTEQDMKMISREVTINQAKMAKDALGAGFRERVMNTRPWKRSEEEDDGAENTVPAKGIRIHKPGG